MAEAGILMPGAVTATLAARASASAPTTTHPPPSSTIIARVGGMVTSKYALVCMHPYQTKKHDFSFLQISKISHQMVLFYISSFRKTTIHLLPMQS
jgi:hypothetical protein